MTNPQLFLNLSCLGLFATGLVLPPLVVTAREVPPVFWQQPAYQAPISAKAVVLLEESKALYHQARFEVSRDKVQQALTFSPQSIPAHLHYIDVQLQLLPPERIKQEYLELMAKEPLNPVYPYVLAKAPYLLDNDEEEIKYLTRASELDPNWPYVQLALGELAATYHKDPSKALVALRKAVELDPYTPEVRLKLADFLFKQNAWSEAIALYQKLKEEFPIRYEIQERLWRAQMSRDKSSATTRDAIQREVEQLRTTTPLSKELLEMLIRVCVKITKDSKTHKWLLAEYQKIPPVIGTPEGMAMSTRFNPFGMSKRVSYFGKRYQWNETLTEIMSSSNKPVAERIAAIEALDRENSDDLVFRLILQQELFRLYVEAKDVSRAESLCKAILACEPAEVTLLDELAQLFLTLPTPDAQKALGYSTQALAILENPPAGVTIVDPELVKQNKALFLTTTSQAYLQLEKLTLAAKFSEEATTLFENEHTLFGQGKVLAAMGETQKAAIWMAQIVVLGKSKAKLAQKELAALAERDSSIVIETLVAAKRAEKLEKDRTTLISSLIKETPRDFTLTSFDGAVYQLSSLKGKVVLINFWASWCGPCREEFPHLARLYDQYKNQGVEFLSLTIDQDRANAETFLRKLNPKFPVFEAKHVKDLYDIRSVPVTYFIDREGNLRHKEVGFEEHDGPTRLEILLNALVKNPATK